MSIKLKGSSDGSVSFDAPADTSPSGSDITLTLPTSAGSANQFLKNSGIAGELEYSSMVENSSGNVGIGTTNPIGDLSVVASGGSGMEFQPEIATDTNRITNFNRSSSTYNNFRLDAAQHEFLISGTEKMRLNTRGELLLGTTDAIADTNDSAIHLKDTSGGNIYFLRNDSSVSGGNDLGTLRFYSNDGGTNKECARLQAEADGSHSSTSRPGRFVFSTVSDNTTTLRQRFLLNRNGLAELNSADHGYDVGVTNGAGTSARLYTGRHSATNGTPGSGTIAFRVFSNGNVQNTNNSYGSISDAKLKENIVDANSQWEDIKGIRVRNYNFIGGETHTQLGVVAQEVELISPGLVTEESDIDDDGNDLGTVTKSVNYSVLYMKAVKALQEAQTRIETLESQHADLLARVTALEAA